MKDPTDIYDVPEDQRLDVDEGPDADASDGGLDIEDLDEFRRFPGEVLEGDLG